MYWFRTKVRRKDELLFFPSYASRSAAGEAWNVNVRGWVFIPKERMLIRRALIRLLRRGLQLTNQEIQSTILKERLRAFLVDNKRHKRVFVRLGPTVHELPKSRPNGHFAHSFTVPADSLDGVHSETDEPLKWHSYDAVLGDGDPRVFRGQFEAINPTGLSIISDIDDTIKITNVADRRELLLNTFLRDFRPVPGMSEVFARWADRGASFHYVSSSPWQLFSPLFALFEDHRFPRGSVHLREFRIKERGTLEHLSGSEAQKRAIIENILAAFPQREFIFVGDSGERDPEMYAGIARDYPFQSRRILIRNVSGETDSSERMRQAFQFLPRDKWCLFNDAEELLRE